MTTELGHKHGQVSPGKLSHARGDPPGQSRVEPWVSVTSVVPGFQPRVEKDCVISEPSLLMPFDVRRYCADSLKQCFLSHSSAQRLGFLLPETGRPFGARPEPRGPRRCPLQAWHSLLLGRGPLRRSALTRDPHS